MDVRVIVNKYFCSDHFLSPKITHAVVEKRGSGRKITESSQSSKWAFGLMPAIWLDLWVRNSGSHSGAEGQSRRRTWDFVTNANSQDLHSPTEKFSGWGPEMCFHRSSRWLDSHSNFRISLLENLLFPQRPSIYVQTEYLLPGSWNFLWRTHVL